MTFILKYPKLVAYIAIIVSVATFWFVFASHYKSAGAKSALDEIEKQNEQAVINSKNNSSAAVECYNSGGVWSVISSQCKR